MQITEILSPYYEVAWLPWAVQYFFLIGIAATSAIVAAACAFAHPGSDWDRVLPSVTTLLLVCAIAAPVSLLADLHQPGRFWHFYVNFTPWSWMSWGAVLLPVFTIVALVFGALWWFGFRRLQRATGVFLVLCAISILVYTGAEVMIVRARVLWHTYLLPVNFVLTAFLGTVGGILLVTRFLSAAYAPLPRGPVLVMGIAASVALVLAALGWMLLGLSGLDASFPMAYAVFAEFPAWRFGLMASLVAGAVILAMLWLWSAREKGMVFQIMLAVMMLSSAWMFRWVVLMSIQSVPKYGAGLYLYSMPLGGDGLMGIVGMFGLCAALISILTCALSLYPENPFRRSRCVQNVN